MIKRELGESVMWDTHEYGLRIVVRAEEPIIVEHQWAVVGVELKTDYRLGRVGIRPHLTWFIVASRSLRPVR